MNSTAFQTIKNLLYKRSFDFGIAFLRLTACTLMLRHGYDKLINFSEKAPDFLDPFSIGSESSLALAIFAEVLCSILVCIGLMTRLSLIPLIFTMLVALFVAHANDPFNLKEMTLIYLLNFLTLLISGPGKISLDFFFFQKKGQQHSHMSSGRK